MKHDIKHLHTLFSFSDLFIKGEHIEDFKDKLYNIIVKFNFLKIRVINFFYYGKCYIGIFVMYYSKKLEKKIIMY